jgi:ADP-heptose:LPS heptosyltransferase
MRAIGAMSAGASVATPPSWDARAHRVLYVRAQGIGDLILATGVLRAIARARPTIALDVLTTPAAAPVLDGNPWVRRIHLLRRTPRDYLALVRAVRNAKYDVVVDGKITRGASFVRSPALTMMSRAPWRVGVGGGNHALVYNLCVERFDRTTTHMVEGSASLARPFGVDPASVDLRPEIFLSGDERRQGERRWLTAAAEYETYGTRWLVNLSAGSAERCWPSDRWIALLRHLRARRPHVTIAVMGVTADWDAVRHVARSSRVAAIASPTLRDAFALVGSAAHVLTSDTSITHAASAFAVPTMVLLQRGLEQWAPWNTRSEIAYWSGENVHALRVDSAMAALDRFLLAHPETVSVVRQRAVSPASSASYPLSR